MRSEISSKQLGTLIFYSFTTIKFINLASLIFQRSADVAFSIYMLLTVVDALVFAGVLWFIKNHAGMSFYVYLSGKIGIFFTKIVYFLIFIFFILRISTFLSGNFAFLRDAIFATASQYFYLAIIIPVIVALGYSGMKAFSRTCEFFFPVILLGVVICLLLGFFSGSFEFPYFSLDISASKFFSDTFSFSYWFGDALFLLLFMDKIQVDKDYIYNSFKYTIVSFVVVFLYGFCFYGMFNTTAFYHSYGIYEMSIFGPNTFDIGRLDIIPVISMMFLIIIQSTILFRAAMHALCDFAGAKKNRNIGAVVLCTLAIVVLCFFVFYNDERAINFMNSDYKWVANFIAYVVPLFAVIVSLFKRRKKNEGKN